MRKDKGKGISRTCEDWKIGEVKVREEEEGKGVERVKIVRWEEKEKKGKTSKKRREERGIERV